MLIEERCRTHFMSKGSSDKNKSLKFMSTEDIHFLHRHRFISMTPVRGEENAENQNTKNILKYLSLQIAIFTFWKTCMQEEEFLSINPVFEIL